MRPAGKAVGRDERDPKAAERDTLIKKNDYKSVDYTSRLYPCIMMS
jgi:hypothetical protein